MSAVNRAKSYQTYTPTQSLGTLTYYNIKHIIKQKSLQSLQQLTNFCERMKLNPLWYQRQSTQNKQKFLQTYQYSINYSKNLKRIYDHTQNEVVYNNKRLKQQVQEKRKNIKQHKKYVDNMKEELRNLKLNHAKNVYVNYQRKLQNLKHEQDQLNQRRNAMQRDIQQKKNEMQTSKQQPQQIVYCYYPFPGGQIPTNNQIPFNMMVNSNIPRENPRQPVHSYPTMPNNNSNSQLMEQLANAFSKKTQEQFEKHQLSNRSLTNSRPPIKPITSMMTSLDKKKSIPNSGRTQKQSDTHSQIIFDQFNKSQESSKKSINKQISQIRYIGEKDFIGSPKPITSEQLNKKKKFSHSHKQSYDSFGSLKQNSNQQIHLPQSPQNQPHKIGVSNKSQSSYNEQQKDTVNNIQNFINSTKSSKINRNSSISKKLSSHNPSNITQGEDSMMLKGDQSFFNNKKLPLQSKIDQRSALMKSRGSDDQITHLIHDNQITHLIHQDNNSLFSLQKVKKKSGFNHSNLKESAQSLAYSQSGQDLGSTNKTNKKLQQSEQLVDVDLYTSNNAKSHLKKEQRQPIFVKNLIKKKTSNNQLTGTVKSASLHESQNDKTNINESQSMQNDSLLGKSQIKIQLKSQKNVQQNNQHKDDFDDGFGNLDQRSKINKSLLKVSKASKPVKQQVVKSSLAKSYNTGRYITQSIKQQQQPQSNKQILKPSKRDSSKQQQNLTKQINNSSISPPQLQKQRNKQQSQEDIQYGSEFQDQQDIDLGLENKNKQKQNEPSNNYNTDNLTEKTINNSSNVNIDISPNNSHYDVTIGQKVQFFQLQNQAFTLKDNNNKQIIDLRGKQKLNTKQQKKGISRQSQKGIFTQSQKGIFTSACDFQSLKQISTYGNQPLKILLASNVSSDFLSDFQMPLNSVIGQRKPPSQANTSLNIRIINNTGQITQTHEIEKQNTIVNTQISRNDDQKFIDIRGQLLTSIIPNTNLSTKQTNHLADIVQSRTFDNQNHKKIPQKRVSFAQQNSNHQSQTNKSDQLSFPVVKKVLQSKYTTSQQQDKQKQQQVDEQKQQQQVDEQKQQQQVDEQQQQVDEQIQFNLDQDISKVHQIQKQQIQKQIVKIIRNTNKFSSLNKDQKNKLITKENKIKYKQTLQKDIQEQIQNIVKQKINNIKDWAQVDKVFNQQLQKIKKIYKNQNLDQKLNLIDNKQILKKKQIKKKPSLKDFDQVDQLNYSTSMVQQNLLSNVQSKKFGQTDTIKEVTQQQAVIKPQKGQKGLSESDLFQLPQKSHFHRPQVAISRQNNLMKPVQQSPKNQTSKSKYAIKLTSSTMINLSVPKQTIVSKMQQNKYGSIQDPLANDISKGNGLIKPKKLTKQIDDQDDF